MIRLETSNIGKRFGNRLLFGGVNLSLREGERIAVVGPNGSGKSTFLRIVAGLLRPSEGTVSLNLNSNSVHADDHSYYMGYVAPSTSVYQALSGRENINFCRSFYSKQGLVTADELLEQVGLEDASDRPVSEYSSGMQQRIKLACALVGNPAVLVLDEPTTNLDVRGRSVVERIIADHNRRGGLAIIATNIDSESASADQVVDIEKYKPSVAGG